MKHDNGIYASENQLLLARLYRFVALVGLTLIALGFVVYVSGMAPSIVPAGEVSQYWHLSAEEYVSETGLPYGWDILKVLNRGESLSLATLVLMPVSIILCLLIMAVAFGKEKNWVYLTVVLLQSAVLVLAASGVIAGR